jgi:predicted DNA-binding protein
MVDKVLGSKVPEEFYDKVNSLSESMGVTVSKYIHEALKERVRLDELKRARAEAGA